MAKSAKKKPARRKAAPKKATIKKAIRKTLGRKKPKGPTAEVLDRLWGVVMSRRDADPAASHSARLLSRGSAKVAQKFGEEAVECLIEAVAGNRDALVAESADVLYHLIVLWVDAGLRPEEIWTELHMREGISGIAEKAARPQLAIALATTKIP
jgi:phosphoribosyl-ATP pyrophosphohydrolase